MFGKDVEKLKSVCNSGGDIKLCSQCGKWYWWFLKELYIDLPYDPIIPFLRTHLKEMKAETWADICTPIFIHGSQKVKATQVSNDG